MSKKRLYLLVASCSFAGVAWVILNLFAPQSVKALQLCPIRAVSGLPCPSCGSTHAVVKILNSDFTGAIHDNPLGFLLVAALFILPTWLLFDTIQRKSTFYAFYNASEIFVRRRWVAFSLIALVAVNWTWSIIKYCQ